MTSLLVIYTYIIGNRVTGRKPGKAFKELKIFDYMQCRQMFMQVLYQYKKSVPDK